MSKIKVSEIFGPAVQGEGHWTGAPSIFLRTFGCNFECKGFGMPPGEASMERMEIDPFKYSRYEDLPLVHTGCDSYPSWDVRFKHLSPMMTVDEINLKIQSLLPGGHWGGMHLVITGGEPLLNWQKEYPELIQLSRNNGLDYLTFETNGTKFVNDELVSYLYDNSDMDVTFSVSAKLSCSGESRVDAIRPEVVTQYQNIGRTYLKFVVATEQDVQEVDEVMKVYRDYGFNGHVYLMPVGGTDQLYYLNRRRVAEFALERGYYYSPRLQIDLFGNDWGR